MFELIAYLLNIVVLILLIRTHQPVRPFKLSNYNELTKGLLILVLTCTIFGFICQIYGTVCGKILVWTPIIMFIVSWVVFGKSV